MSQGIPTCRAALALALLLWTAPVAVAQPELALVASDCDTPWSSAAELAPALALELASVGLERRIVPVDEAPTGRAWVRVTVPDCDERGDVSLVAVDAVGRGAVRRVGLRDVATPARGRTVALALADFAADRFGTTGDGDAPSPTAPSMAARLWSPSPELHEVRWAAHSEPPKPRLTGAALITVRALPGRGTRFAGPMLRGSGAVDRAARVHAGAALSVAFAGADDPLGHVDATLLRLHVHGEARDELGPLGVAVGLELAVGIAFVEADARPRHVALAQDVNRGVADGAAYGRLAVPLHRHLDLLAELGLGWTLVGFTVDADGERTILGVDGLALLLRVGVEVH